MSVDFLKRLPVRTFTQSLVSMAVTSPPSEGTAAEETLFIGKYSVVNSSRNSKSVINSQFDVPQKKWQLPKHPADNVKYSSLALGWMKAHDPRSIDKKNEQDKKTLPNQSDTLVYTASFKPHDGRNSKGAVAARLAAYKKSRVLMTICVGHNEFHTGERFNAIYKKLLDSFDSVCIMIADSVQGITLARQNPDLSRKELRENAMMASEDWLHRHEKYINAVPETDRKRVSIVFWQDWEKNPDEYKKMVDEMYRLYDTNETIKTAMDGMAQEVCDRMKERGESYDPVGAIEYAIEECALMAYKWSTLDAQYEIFAPRRRPEAMNVLHNYLVANHLPGLPQELHMGCQSRKSVKAKKTDTDDAIISEASQDENNTRSFSPFNSTCS